MTSPALTVADLDAGLQRDDWLGFGYLGERKNFFANYGMSVVPQIAAADAFVLKHANARGWTADDLFAWANSKNGRWTGEDLMTGRAPTFAPVFPDSGWHAVRYITLDGVR